MAVLFGVACFVSLAMGTSVGTITLLTPIAVAVSAASGFGLPLCVASVIGGSMFGDNLSFISDTTIAACNGQGCAMKDKFRENFWIALPAAVCDITSDFNSVFPDGHFRIRDRELSSASDRAVYSGTGGWHHRCQCVCRVTDRNCVRCDH